MVRVAGDHFLKLLDFSVVAKVAVFVGLTIYALISSVEILLMKKMSSLSNCTASLVTILEEEAIAGVFTCKNLKNSDGGKCQELNLELRICPPCQQPPQAFEDGGRKVLCFYCSLGMQNSKGCSCSGSSRDTSVNFLGTKNGALDCRL
ncbi:hypothetical protein Tsubulata_030225 [Turnera subulata]|uniref:Uncharacterized protein n=1 Tax=Turnera subulata TaxID=218843 RepID=A0A9Q0JJT1_9ROSI|nr:hypothetical protein Tsubulata_030225 [Turnera subulata]